MYTVRKSFTFEAAHRLVKSYSKECQQVHGHSYTVEVFVTSRILNSDGMVIDFKLLGEVVEPLIARWDHECLIAGKNITFNPTAENMALYLWRCIRKAKCIDLDSMSIKVRVHETATGWAEHSA